MVARRENPQAAIAVSSFPVTAGTYFVQVRDDLLALVAKFHPIPADQKKSRKQATQERCMAMILGVLVHWTDDRLKKQSPTWINLTLDQWVTECRDFFQRDVIRVALSCLARIGVVSAEDYTPPRGGKPFKQYRLNVDALKKWAGHTPNQTTNTDIPSPEGSDNAPDNVDTSMPTPPTNVDKPTPIPPNHAQPTLINQRSNVDKPTLPTTHLSSNNVDKSMPPILSDSSLDKSSKFEDSKTPPSQKNEGEKTPPPPSKPQPVVPLPALIEQLTNDLTRDLRDEPENAKSNRTRIAKIYHAIIAWCPSNTDEDIYQFFKERKYAVMQYTSIRHHNKAGQPNRMPAYFDRVLRDLQSKLQLTVEELTALRDGAYLPAPRQEEALT